MSRGVDKRVELLLKRAEVSGMCLPSPAGKADNKALRRRLSSSVVSPQYGMYARREYWEALDRSEKALHIARALHVQHPDWVFCGPTATAAYGMETPLTLLGKTYRVGSRSSSAGDVVAMRVDAGIPDFAQGIPVTDALASAVDALAVSSFPEGLAVADSAMRLFGMTNAELEQGVCRRARGKRGAATARRVAAAANPLSENGGESFARGVMIEEGFQEPLLQVEIPDPVQKGKVHRVDYLWGSPEHPIVIGELDGREKLESPEMRRGRSMAEVLRDERTRESRLSLTGARILRFTFAEVMQRKRFAAMLDRFGVPRVKGL